MTMPIWRSSPLVLIADSMVRKDRVAMKFSYYPGCTLRNKAKDLDAYARASAKALGFELEELSDWQCCGGVYPLGTDEIASKLSSVRALAQAKEKGQALVTLCSACHHVPQPHAQRAVDASPVPPV